MIKIPLQHSQFVMLEEAFHKVEDIPVDTIARYMHAFLPAKYFRFEGAKPFTKDLFKKEIITGGSCAYEALISASYRANCPELGDLLRATRTPLLFRWVWVWSEDNLIMKRGKSWFVTREDCLQQGKRKTPSYYTWDGPDSPDAQLSLEAVCPCMVHRVDQPSSDPEEDPVEIIATPCACFYPHETPAYAQGKPGEICLDGLTIMKSPFQLDRGTRYVIKETGEQFSSLHRDTYAAYMERKRRLINSAYEFCME